MTNEPSGFFEGTGMPDAGWWEALWPDPATVLARVGIEPGMDAVDLCAGDGLFTLAMSRVARQVFAIDIDGDLLSKAGRRLREADVGNCDFIVGDAYEVARLVPHPVDFVLMANAFHGVPNKPRLTDAVRQTLRSGGHFAIVNWHRRSRDESKVLGEPRGPSAELRLSPDQTVEMVETGHMKFARLVELPPHHYCAVFERARMRGRTER